MFIWQTLAETFHVDCLISTVKHGGGSDVMVRGGISWNGFGLFVTEGESQRRALLYNTLIFTHYISDSVFQEHLLLQDDKASVQMARSIQTWLDEHNRLSRTFHVLSSVF